MWCATKANFRVIFSFPTLGGKNLRNCYLLKRTTLRGPDACVSNGNMKTLKWSEISPTLAPCFYMKTSTEETSNCNLKCYDACYSSKPGLSAFNHLIYILYISRTALTFISELNIIMNYFNEECMFSIKHPAKLLFAHTFRTSSTMQLL